MNIYQCTMLLLCTTLLLIFTLSPTANAFMLYQRCGTTGNYTANSTYASNFQTLMTNLTTGATNSTTNFGFAKNTVGNVSNQIWGLVLCRGDTDVSSCSSCISQATQDIQNLCPYNKKATICYDNCLLSFSNQDFLSLTNYSAQHYYYKWNNRFINGSQTLFDSYVTYLINITAQFAAFNSSKRYATAQSDMLNSFPETYGLAQCTPDLSSLQCASCLNGMISQMPKYFSGRIGARILDVRCNLRYEIYSFTSGGSLLSVEPPSATNLTTAQGKKTSTGITILEITVPLVLAFATIAGLYVCILRRRNSALTRTLMNVSNSEDIKSIESLLLNLSELRIATTNFSDENKLGEGGFGVVYKGVLPDRQEIAIKRLSESSSQGLRELKNELCLLEKLQHKNLVRLLGVCLEGQEKMLVYEYVPNKSLDHFIFNTEKGHLLGWGKRYSIICGIARGLLYLHEESQLRIIHRDLKASNVLLDAEMDPKISDFGLARLFLGDQTRECTNRVAGTFGYMAPEYVTKGHFSVKSDVFSFGVLVLEIITGKKNSYSFENEYVEGPLSFVWKHWTEGTITDVVDPSLGQNYSSSELLRCIHIGLLCVQDNPNDRPTMSSVVVMLSSKTVSLENPSRPAFCLGESRIHGGMTDRSPNQSIPVSLNEVTITGIEPR